MDKALFFVRKTWENNWGVTFCSTGNNDNRNDLNKDL